MDKTDRDLGMDTDITRRDFLDGVAFTATAAAAASTVGSVMSSSAQAAAASPAIAYPPQRQGMRGFNQSAVDAGHAVRDGAVADTGTDTGEVFDLVVVGGGMAGLSAAYFYRKQIPNAKVLIVDGCDDFGGHARRNEFVVDGKTLIAGGGTGALWYPNTFAPESQELMRDIGIDRPRYYKAVNEDPNPIYSLGLKPAVYFSKEMYGSDRLVTNSPLVSATGGSSPGTTPAPTVDREALAAFLAKTPMSEGAKAGLIKLYTDTTDYMPGISTEEKIRQLKKMSYVDYLTKVVQLHPDAIAYVTMVGGSGGNQGAGPDTYSAWYAHRRRAFGFAGMGLPFASQNSNLTKDPGQHVRFPDNAAGAARLLVRWLIPDAVPGTTMEDQIVARINYDSLDRPGNDVRIRLSSTAVRVRHLGDPLTAKEVEVTYLREGRPHRVRGGAVVMACFNNIIPYLVPELPEAQKTALHWAVRKPLCVFNVAVRNWRAFQKLGVSDISSPDLFFTSVGVAIPPAVGVYKNPTSPDEPVILRMNLSNKVLEMPGSGLSARDQWKGARAQLQAITFETFERNIRQHLDRVLGPGGFNSRRDIAGIIINRWGHAFAGGSNELYDPDWSHRTDAPWVVGRQRFGRITISNSDSAAVSLTNAAWAQSHRAVNEIITNIVRPVYDFHFSERDTAGEPGDYPNNF